jgi:hypothetical protein
MFRSLTISSLALLAGAVTAGAQTADVQIIHNSPDPGAATVDIYVDGTLAVPDLAFRAATGVVPLPAGVELVVGIAPGDSDGPGDILASFPFTLTAGESYVIMAAGVLDPPSFPSNPEGVSTAFDLYVQPGLLTSDPGSNVSLLAFHGSPDAPTVDVNAVGVGTLFGSLQYTDFQGYLSVPPAEYELQVTPAGQPGTVVATFTAPLDGLGGGAAVVFASGFLSAAGLGGIPAFGLYAALADGTVLPLDHSPVSVDDASWSAVKSYHR